MRILVYDKSSGLEVADLENIRKAEYDFRHEYDWSEEYDSVDGVIILSNEMPHCYDGQVGKYGLLIAAEAQSKNIPCFIVVRESWEINLARKLGAVVVGIRDDYTTGFDFVQLRGEMRKRLG